MRRPVEAGTPWGIDVTAYADDLRRRYPELTISRHVVCTIGAAVYRFFTVA